jgi:hypothetical protein
MLLKKIFWFWWREKKISDSEFLSYGLTEKFKYYGLSEGLVKWFQDYVSNRKQIVFINNSESRIYRVT